MARNLHDQLRQFWFTALLAISGAFVITDQSTLAQITPDSTLGSERSSVRQINRQIDRIEGGAIRGTNLFHSFQEFNVGQGRSVYFGNPNGIENIVSRVTGTDVSDILGTLGVDGTANLFLLNPNGIIFGPNARLDVRGSFLASTANAIQFDNQGSFSASDPDAPSLLTVNPSALLFNQITTAPLVNQARAGGSSSRNPGGLRVPNGRSLLLVGGDVVLDGGSVYAPGGRVELAGVRGLGVANLTVSGSDLRLGILDETIRADVVATNRATVQVSGARSGSIQIQGRQVRLSDRSEIIADTSGDQNGGGISIRASRLTIRDGAQVSASMLEESQGNSDGVEVIATDSVNLVGTARGQGSGSGSGERPSKIAADARGSGQSEGVVISTGRLVLRDGARLSSSTINRDRGGSIVVNASEEIVVRGTSSERQRSSALSVQTRGTGRAGDLTLNTSRLVLQEGGEVSASTYGTGAGGNLVINATDRVEVVGTAEIRDRSSQEEIGTVEQGQLSSRLVAETGRPLTVRDAGLVIGTGDGGTLSITTRRLIIRDGAEVSASSFGTGNGGDVIVRASESVNVIGTSPDHQVPSQLAVETGRPLQLPGGQGLLQTGRGGSLRITTGELSVAENAEVIVDSLGLGRAGNLEVRAETIALNERGRLTAETVFSRGGNIDLQIANNLSLDNNSRISASTQTGQAGSLSIHDVESINLSGESSLAVQATGEGGIAGDLRINTGQFLIEDGAAATVSSQEGRAGNLSIAADTIRLDDGSLNAETAESDRQGGANINLQVPESLSILGDSEISANARDFANGGNIIIDGAGLIVAVPSQDSDISANAERGNGGRVDILAAQGIFGIEFREQDTLLSDITVSSEFGEPGTVSINRPEVDPSQGLANLPTETVSARVDQRCQAGGTATSRFVETGQGGLSPSPSEASNDSDIWTDLRLPQERATPDTTVANETSLASGVPEPIVEAQGWVIDANNTVVLVSEASTVTPYSSWRTPIACRSSN